MLTSEEVTLLEDLPPRTKQVVERIALGMANRDIAAELRISERTVKNVLQHLAEQLDIDAARMEVIRYFFDITPKVRGR